MSRVVPPPVMLVLECGSADGDEGALWWFSDVRERGADQWNLRFVVFGRKC